MIPRRADRVIALWGDLKRELVAEGGRDGAAKWMEFAAQIMRIEATVERRRKRARGMRLAWTNPEARP